MISPHRDVKFKGWNLEQRCLVCSLEWESNITAFSVIQGEATHGNLVHLAMMERVLGPLSQHMLKRADRHAEKYVWRGRLDWPEDAASRESINYQGCIETGSSSESCI